MVSQRVFYDQPPRKPQYIDWMNLHSRKLAKICPGVFDILDKPGSEPACKLAKS
jgi:hypothetical protein